MQLLLYIYKEQTLKLRKTDEGFKSAIRQTPRHTLDFWAQRSLAATTYAGYIVDVFVVSSNPTSGLVLTNFELEFGQTDAD